MSEAAELQRRKAEAFEPMLTALRDTADYLWNPFERDNQSIHWLRIKAAIAQAEAAMRKEAGNAQKP